MKTKQTENLGCLKDGLEYFVADSRGNKLSEAFGTAEDVYDEIKSLINHGKPDKPAPAQVKDSPTQAQHSPLPWTMDETLLGSPSGQKYIRNAVTANGKLVGQLVGFSEVNALHVIRACNNVQRLADALTTIAVKAYQGIGKEDYSVHPDIIEQAREALAQWEGSK